MHNLHQQIESPKSIANEIQREGPFPGFWPEDDARRTAMNFGPGRKSPEDYALQMLKHHPLHLLCAEASWSAAVLCRFAARAGTNPAHRTAVKPIQPPYQPLHPLDRKAPEDWRTPKASAPPPHKQSRQRLGVRQSSAALPRVPEPIPRTGRRSNPSSHHINLSTPLTEKRQRTGALQKLAHRPPAQAVAPASWSAAVLCRFGLPFLPPEAYRAILVVTVRASCFPLYVRRSSDYFPAHAVI